MKYIFHSIAGNSQVQDQLCSNLIRSFESSTTFITAGRSYFRFFHSFIASIVQHTYTAASDVYPS